MRLRLGSIAASMSRRKPLLVRASSVVVRPVEWLWPGKIPSGKLTLLAGSAGLGKSLVSLDLAARLSRGAPWPDEPQETAHEPAGVILLAAEDGAEDTAVPRLLAAGANLDRITLLRGARDPFDARRAFQVALDRDLCVLADAIEETGAKLVVIDPISEFMGRADSHRTADVRRVLSPLANLAAKRRVAVVAIAHLNKNERASAIHRTGGSVGFVAVARAVWGVLKDQDDPRRRLLLPIKCNLSQDARGLAFMLQEHPAHGQPVVGWEPDPVTLSADDMLAPRDRRADRPERRAAAEWLRQTLAGGPLPTTELERRAADAGHAWGSVLRAKKDLKIVSRREGFGPGSVSRWEMPIDAHTCAPPNRAQL